MYKFGFIGLGNMGKSIFNGLLKENSKEKFIFTEKSEPIIQKIINDYDIKYTQSIEELCSNSKYIFLAIKPQNYEEVMKKMKNSLNEDSIIISIAPGFSIYDIKSSLNIKTKVIRCMPNTPALVLEGMSIASISNDNFSELEISEIKNIFSSFGQFELVSEDLMDAVVPISGSSPAYVYIMIEAMADCGVSQGLPRKLAYKLAAQSVLGAAKMVIETHEHPAILKDAVCSPGGTTISAVRELEKRGFRSSIIEAMWKAYEKTQNIK